MTDLQIVYVVVFAVMSIVGFLSMYVDKTKAKRRKWRTPEWVLFLIAVLFGGVGSTAGMYVFRHKTRHWYFKVFMPCLAVIDIVPKMPSVTVLLSHFSG